MERKRNPGKPATNDILALCGKAREKQKPAPKKNQKKLRKCVPF
jgi:hypothetical protein